MTTIAEPRTTVAYACLAIGTLLFRLGPRAINIFCLILLLVAALAVTGCVSTSRHQSALIDCATISTAASGDAALSALKRLRRGDTSRAVQSLEQHLDAQIMLLEHFLSDIPEPQRDARVVKFLERARAYRTAHPSDGGE